MNRFWISTTVVKGAGCCPVCESRLDGATFLHGPSRPKDGDVSVCAYCGTWLVVFNGKEFRRMEEHEIDDLPKDILAELVLTSQAMRQFREAKKI